MCQLNDKLVSVTEARSTVMLFFLFLFLCCILMDICESDCCRYDRLFRKFITLSNYHLDSSEVRIYVIVLTER